MAGKMGAVTASAARPGNRVTGVTMLKITGNFGTLLVLRL